MKITALLLLFSLTISAQLENDITLFDKSRNREIPVALYLPAKIQNAPLVIIGHGYNQNQPGANKGYSFIANALAQKGYMVASIQHELPTDSIMPTTGDIQVVRKPFWDSGSANILHVINDFKKRYPKLNFSKIILIGHSMGGDISATFTKKHPKLVYKLITLDQRRVAFPRVSKPKIYSLRSSDQVADDGVLPTSEEQKKFSITIQKLPNTIHNDMNDNATETQKKEMLDWILNFVK
ncbi:MAG: alpha/beta fold hydrolase [Bacteroidota bacterium]